MTQLIRSILVTLILLSAGCSSEEPGTSGEHVWKQQTDTIKRAEQVEATIMEAAEQQRELIEQQE